MSLKNCQKFCLILLLPLCFSIKVKAQEMIFFTEFNDFNLGTWLGQGNISQTESGCIVYFDDPNYLYTEYRLQARQAGRGGGVFALRNGTDTIPYSLEVEDLHNTGTYALNPGVYSPNLTYDPFCTAGSPPNGPNADLTLDINAVDLLAVPAGTYTGRIRLRARRVGGGASRAQQFVNASVTVDPLSLITGIDDINFGTYDGVAASLTRNESFCIYSNFNSGSYALRPSTTTTLMGDPNSFAVVSAGSDRLRYTVRVDGPNDASAGALVNNNQQVSGLNTNQTTPYSTNCNNVDNAAIFLEFSGSDLQAAPPGTYSGVITLMVEAI